VAKQITFSRWRFDDDALAAAPLFMNNPAYQFPNEFFDYMDPGSRRSAASIVALLEPKLKPKSVLDVGCGRGVWPSEWGRAGVADSTGVDGPYVDRASLAIPPESFIAWDLSQPLQLNRHFDLVQSLEVAQCIDSAYADIFVDSLCRHGELIMFSAAVPGQGGERHVNEQPLEYWREKFAVRGYAAFDWIRPVISALPKIEPWYRYNCLLYATARVAADLPPKIQATRIATGARVAELAPATWRMRNAVLRSLPAGVVHRLALVKHKLHNLTGS
jgi:SAM-dependent methyltransferase